MEPSIRKGIDDLIDKIGDSNICVHKSKYGEKLTQLKKIQAMQDQINKKSFFYARDLEHETATCACVYCKEITHKSMECMKVASVKNRNKILAKRKHHMSICDEPPPQEKLLTAQYNYKNTVVYPVVILDVEGVKCPVLLDTGAGNSYASAALLDRLSKRESKLETKKIEMMLGTTTQEMEQQTITMKGISEQFLMLIEVQR